MVKIDNETQYTFTLKNTHNIEDSLDDYFVFYYDSTNVVHEEFQWHFDAWEDFEEHPSAEIMLMNTLAVGSENTLKMGGYDFYYLGNHKYAVKMDVINRYPYIAIPIFFGSGDTYKIYAVYDTATIGNTMQSVFQARNYIISERVIFENHVAPSDYTETYLYFNGAFYECSSNSEGDHMYGIVGLDCTYESLNNGYNWYDSDNFYKRRTSYNGIYINSNSFPLKNDTDYGSTNASGIFSNKNIRDCVNFNEDLKIIIMYA